MLRPSCGLSRQGHPTIAHRFNGGFPRQQVRQAPAGRKNVYGDPLSVYSRVLETWVEGKKAFDLSKPEDQLYAEGGMKAGSDLDPFLCCFAPAWQGGAK